MSTRLCLPFAVLLVLAAANVAARDPKMSSADSGACPEAEAAREPARATRVAPVRETKARPSLHSDAAPRITPRWHSFLPGMFR